MLSSEKRIIILVGVGANFEEACTGESLDMRVVTTMIVAQMMKHLTATIAIIEAEAVEEEVGEDVEGFVGHGKMRYPLTAHRGILRRPHPNPHNPSLLLPTRASFHLYQEVLRKKRVLLPRQQKLRIPHCRQLPVHGQNRLRRAGNDLELGAAILKNVR